MKKCLIVWLEVLVLGPEQFVCIGTYIYCLNQFEKIYSVVYKYI